MDASIRALYLYFLILNNDGLSNSSPLHMKALMFISNLDDQARDKASDMLSYRAVEHIDVHVIRAI